MEYMPIIQSNFRDFSIDEEYRELNQDIEDERYGSYHGYGRRRRPWYGRYPYWRYWYPRPYRYPYYPFPYPTPYPYPYYPIPYPFPYPRIY